MVKIAYVLLCHKDPDALIGQVRQLTAAGDCVAIHFDARAPAAAYARLRAGLADDAGVTFAAERVKCGWGEWSLVQGTLNALEAAVAAFPDATHFYLLSGDCMPIKTAEFAHRLLAPADADYVESFDFFTSGWIRTGLRDERLIYRHVFNERTQTRRFYAAMRLQQRLGLRRAPPADLSVRIGSQWWCLRRATVTLMLDFIRARPDVVRFFRTTWIPDESFFQTLAGHLVPEAELRMRPLTFLIFSDYGMPVTFCNDHYALLLSQDFLFARKISPEAHALKRRLGALYQHRGAEFAIAGGGRRLHGFLTGRGRVGRRFARRFWERQAQLGRDRELLIVACKKWHVGRRLIERIGAVTGMPVVGYLFDEPDTPLPDLGGIETGMAKRARHRRALMRILFDHYRADRMAICVDPASVEPIADLCAAQCSVQLLQVECRLDDAFLVGHARRNGLIGAATPAAVSEQLLRTLRHDIGFEAEQLRDSALAQFHRIAEASPAAQNARALSAFLRVEAPRAHAIAATDDLFSD